VAGKILVVDDISTNRIVLKVKLAAARYEVHQAATGAEALRFARTERPDLILLDVQLPDLSGIKVCEALKSDPRTCAIPVVMVTAFRDQSVRLRALGAGAEEVFWKPLDETVLLARLRSLLRARETDAELTLRDTTYRALGFAEASGGFQMPATIALVAGDTATARRWKRDLAPYVDNALIVVENDAALNDAPGTRTPDVFVVAADLAATGDGLRLLSELRSRPTTRYSAVCIVLGRDTHDTAAMALDLGASDLIEADADPRETALRLHTQVERKQQADRLRASVADGLRLAMTDPLTGLHNRRYALPHLARIAARAVESGRQFAIMVLDLDHFKSVNDTHGHAAGDAVLVEVAARLRTNLRAVDLIARIGGEEFLVALPDTTLDASRITAERLRRKIQEQPVDLPNGTRVSVTTSIGLAMGGGTDRTVGAVAELVAQADTALMGAKADGRNLVTVSRSAA
jgi:two-component system cell cycle response regulator